MRWRRKRSDADFAEEIRAHLELEQDQLESEGVTRQSAAYAANRAFGNVAAVQEQHYEKGRWTWADSWFKDLRYALRMLRKTPWFTAAAVVILAFAIGANLCVFELIDALVLRSIPVFRPEELVTINPVGPQGPLNGMPSTVLDALRQEPVWRGVCGFTTPRVTTNINGAIASTGTLAMTGDCFRTLGVSTQIGRPFTIADDGPEAANVVVLTAALWRRDFGGSPAVLGKQIQAGADTFTVIGVAADDFTGVLLGFEPGLIIPLHHTPGDLPNQRFRYYWVSIFCRLAPGVSQTAAQARIAAMTRPLLEQSVPARYNAAQRGNYLANHLVVSSARTGVDWMLRDRFGRTLYLLFGVCVAILLIACLNLAGLAATRALARQKEVGIRLAIGGTPWRVLRPLAIEGVLLAIGGGLGGLLFASWASRAIVEGASAMLPNFSMNTSLTARGILWLAATVALVAVALIAVPVWQARRSRGIRNLREAGRGIAGTSSRAQRVLIAAQVAFTLALVSACGVCASSFASLLRLPLGLDLEGLGEGPLSPLPGGYGMAELAPYYTNFLHRVSLVPGVQSASLSSFALYWHKLYPELVLAAGGTRELRAQTIRVTDGYFRTVGVSLRAGEDFARDHAQPEAIVSESIAKLLGGNVLGEEILVGETGAAKRYRVVGVAPTMRISMEDPRDSSPLAVYLNMWQDPKEQRYPVLYVRGAGGRPPDARALAAAVQSLGREYLDEFRPLASIRDESIAEDRVLAYLAAVFGFLGLLLAAIGLFAILSGYVAGRTSEIGVRMALGANPARICGLVLRQVGAVMSVGIGAGVGVALAAGSVLASATYGLSPRNPLLLAASAGLLILTGLAAALLPAKRAARIQPLVALRQD